MPVLSDLSRIVFVLCKSKCSQGKRYFLTICDLSPHDILLLMILLFFVWKTKWPVVKEIWMNRFLALCDLGLFFAMIHATASVVYYCTYVIPQPTGHIIFYAIVVLYFIYLIHMIRRKEQRKKESEQKEREMSGKGKIAQRTQNEVMSLEKELAHAK
jgi:FlaA1/EpsC-like NDP-sugar epimerase